MQTIKRNKLTNIAIFVIRLSKTANVGAKRFALIKDAITSAMSTKPFNKFINVKQGLSEQADGVTHEEYADQQMTTIKRCKLTRMPRRQGQGLGPGRKMTTSRKLDSNKRRRERSPSSFEYTFDEPEYIEGAPGFTAWSMGMEQSNMDLGASWPSLAQSATIKAT